MKLALPIVMLFMSTTIQANCTKLSHAPVPLDQYYQSASGLEGHALKVALNDVIRGHTRYNYTPCVWTILREADEAPGDPNSVVGFYTNRIIAKAMQDNGSRGDDAWNREHIWAKSHGFPKKSQHAFTDAHHIRAADRSVNTDRSDHDFDNGGMPDDECNGCFEGNGTWEPPDRVKGDVARIMFYMDVRYDGNDGSGTPDLQLADRASTPRSETSGEFGKLCTLLGWHSNDPVSPAERTRNEIIHSWQGNRNPFIDHPEFAVSIFGSRCPILSPAGGSPSDPNTTPVDTNPSEVEELRRLLNDLERQIEVIRLRLEGL